MKIVGEERYKPLGKGRFHPAGSVGDQRIAEIVSSYKQDIAGAYTSVSCDAIRQNIPSGRHIVATKVDGEQWFLLKNCDGVYLISPNGKVIAGIEAMEEAEEILQDWTGLLAGELYAAVETGRPRVYDLHSVLGGGIDAETSRIHFAAFDLLDGENDSVNVPFSLRAESILELLSGGRYVHAVDFAEAEGLFEIESFFISQTTENNAEGIVVRCDDGRIFKIKPDISIDAAVIGYTASANGIHDLLIGLMTENDDIQLIGRVDIGFSMAERKELLDRFAPLSCESALYLTSRNGLPYTWVRPEIVVEVTCHELLTNRSDGEPDMEAKIAFPAHLRIAPTI
jgi:ATP-dependent DNA ligase